MPHPTKTLRQRLDAAKAKLPSVTERYSRLSIQDQRLLGELPEKVGNLSEVMAVEKFDERLPATAPKPATARPAAHKPSAGAAALAAVTNPATRGPAVAGLTKSIEASAKPDFSFLQGGERLRISAEFAKQGGLSKVSHSIYTIRRRQFCEEHKMTPEQASGAPVVIPKILSPEEIKGHTAATVAASRKKSPFTIHPSK